ncbi:MAG: threonine synthase [Chthonomonadales bacterium]|nr:threonine synthase [Chthonomonadales bacterium]
MNPGILEAYRRFLPVTDATPVVTLLEGATPLLPAPRLAAWIGAPIRLFLKLEGMNPTGSFKDRGMAMAISKAAESGARAVMCASTGNTSASAAAYAARAGLACHVLIPSGKIALGKLAQALAHGARVLAVDGNFDAALRLVREITDSYPVTLVNSLNPFRIEGQKTAAFEIVDFLGVAPDYHALPVGNAGNITAYWRGYREYQAAGRSGATPVMLGFQAEGAAPLVLGAPVAAPETVATAIRIGRPASWDGAVAARDESGGLIEAVSDAEILAAYRAAASLEGVFAEPASAAPLAGLRKLSARGFLPRDATVVATLTGHGLKDPDTAVREAGGAVTRLPAERGAVLAALGYGSAQGLDA